ncbi:F-box/LRR-repeat protein [Trifolium pratense]|uniref:F-box/LRR-repeat protein n=1 Tax=Trifolium pratense TaxID=57577 RepID=A0A2K3MWR4_TRIPR|nr:F-box/LRR-repeat protein [Trifolium pratense]
MEQEEDQLSNLPKIILHNILSWLPEEDAARTSVLSKAWLETWYTFPNLSFRDFRFIGKPTQPVEAIVVLETLLQPMEDLQKKRMDFSDYVKSRLARFSKQKLAIEEFKLSVNCFELGYMSRDVDLWLKLASESGVEVLELCNHRYNYGECRGDQCYVLPKSVIEAKSLTNIIKSLSMHGLQKLKTVEIGGIKEDAPMFLDILTPPPTIKHMNLLHIHDQMSENLFPDLADFLLLCCVPATISLSLNTTSGKSFTEACHCLTPCSFN